MLIIVSVELSIVNSRYLPGAEISSHNLARQCPSRQVSEENMELLKRSTVQSVWKRCGL